MFSDDLESEPKKMETSTTDSSQKIQKIQKLPSNNMKQYVYTSDGKFDCYVMVCDCVGNIVLLINVLTSYRC